MRAGFLYDSDLRVLITGVSQLRSFASRRNARRAEIVCDGEAPRDFRDTAKRRLLLDVGSI
jgi:hypothetical protein